MAIVLHKVALVGEGAALRGAAAALIRRRSALVVLTPDGALRDELRGKRIEADSLDDIDGARLREHLRDADAALVAFDAVDPLSAALRRLQAAAPGVPLIVLSPREAQEALSGEFPQVYWHRGMVGREEILRSLRSTQIRRKVERLKVAAGTEGRLLILLYGNPDPDAVASAHALRVLLKRTHENCTIGYTGEIARPENQAMIQSLRLPLTPFTPSMLEEHDVVATVDAQPSFFKSMDLKIPFTIVIDHHPRAGNGESGAAAPQDCFVDVQPRVGSTSTLLTNYFLETGEPIPRNLATALYYGLKVDTQNLQRVASEEDLRAFRHLRKAADLQRIRTIEFTQFLPASLDYFAIAILRKRIWKNTVFTCLGTVPSADLLAQIADFFLKLQGINWSIVSGIAGGKLVTVFRSDGYHRHAGRVAKTALGDAGSAGGHKEMARSEIPLEVLERELPGLSLEHVERYLLGRLAGSLPAIRQIRKTMLR